MVSIRGLSIYACAYSCEGVGAFGEWAEPHCDVMPAHNSLEIWLNIS